MSPDATAAVLAGPPRVFPAMRLPSEMKTEPPPATVFTNPATRPAPSNARALAIDMAGMVEVHRAGPAGCVEVGAFPSP